MIPVACCLISNKAGEFLLAQKSSGEWEFPGGKQQVGETIFQCAEREIKEELNIEIFAFQELAYTHIVRSGEKQFQLILIKCEYLSGTPELKEHQKAAWFTPSQIRNLLLCPGDNLLWRKNIGTDGVRGTS